MNVRVNVYFNGDLIASHILQLDCMVNVPLLGYEISKDARYPSELRIEVEKVKV